MKKATQNISLAVLVLGGALGVSAFAQTASTPEPTSTQPAATSSMNPNDSSTYATGQPLQMQSKEGFWGHVNPFARKKWVKRQLDPIRDRDNELDQLQAKNANDIRDVDSRAQAGIHKAMDAAGTADQHAQDASNRANSAQTLADNTSTRENSLNTTVGNLDNYQQVSATTIPFASGRTSLGPKGKADLDNLATTLPNEKGYIIEVQGYSRSGIANSQAMADAVARYLVTEHQVPVYRIYKTGMGRDTAKSDEGGDTIHNGVRVALMHNSLATMNANSAANTAPAAPAASAQTGTSNPSEMNNQ
ncbi:hypothetical protein GCM10011507_17740 [Edaphobacter acidisoli]|uniref:OmpA-like domain-containing protein n=1 Tax=Edaphobacter acidisoli TaxID=2040573 RepID=A0A916W4Y0_9BACT|nr:OmpA family protein [Edaphobacter acidisoli]GGA66669.1 hypothetical protein GCM10011507_17740 [Edaphobacter acidisoli]